MDGHVAVGEVGATLFASLFYKIVQFGFTYAWIFVYSLDGSSSEEWSSMDKVSFITSIFSQSSFVIVSDSTRYGLMGYTATRQVGNSTFQQNRRLFPRRIQRKSYPFPSNYLHWNLFAAKRLNQSHYHATSCSVSQGKLIHFPPRHRAVSSTRWCDS